MNAVNGVSLVITCFNQARWLGDALDSVLAQTTPAAEVIVVDDGSTDDTAAVCRRYRDVRYLWQANAGLPTARNAGMSAATGSYLCFLDADDLLTPRALEHGLKAFGEHPSWTFAFGGYQAITETRQFIYERRHPAGEISYSDLLQRNVIGMHGAVLYRQHAIRAAGGFDTGLTACEDYDLYLRIVRTRAAGSHGHVVAQYRRHAAGMSTDPARMLTNMMTVLGRHNEYVRDSTDRAMALRKARRFYRNSYGVQLITGALGAVSSGRWADASSRLHLATQLAPQAFPVAVVRELRARASGIEQRLPFGVRRIARKVLGRRPPRLAVGRVKFGDLRRVEPVDASFGFSRGLPVDRYYIEQFLNSNSSDVAGRVLEIGDNSYTLRFGGDRVTRSDVLHVSPDAPLATIVGDLENAAHIESDSFDCIILTQTLHLVFDLPRAVGTLHRILKPGGRLLLTVPGISQVDRGEWRDSWYWALTSASVRRLLETQPWQHVTVDTFGNVLSAMSFLQGLAAEELRPEELDVCDHAYQLIATARAVKAAIPGVSS